MGFNIFDQHGARIESVPVYAKELGMSAPTLASHVEKAKEAGELSPAGQQGRTLYFRQVDMDSAISKYGRKPKPNPLADKVNELEESNTRLSGENAELLLRIRELEEALESERARAEKAEAYSESIISG